MSNLEHGCPFSETIAIPGVINIFSILFKIQNQSNL